MRRAMPLATGAMIALLASAGSAEVGPTAVNFENGAVAQPLTATSGDPAEGADIIGNKKKGNCVACHQVSAVNAPWQGTVAPPLDGAGDRWSEAELRGIVANAKQMFPGSMMPSFYRVDGYIRPGDGFTGEAAKEVHPILTAQQVEDVVAFLKTLKQ